LNWSIALGLVLRWKYEDLTFEFPVPKGSKFYTPDFHVWLPNGESEFHEIKGYMDAKSKTKLGRMQTHYPQHHIKVIGKVEYAAVRDSVAALIPHWERRR
jgi:hypothetical protein